MPVEEFGGKKQFTASVSLPQNLEHKPIFAMPYEKFDGMYKGNTDARYLSVGLAQWNRNDVSLKIMRHTGETWSRQAEELPLHRVIDSAIFLTKVLLDVEDNNVEIERNQFHTQSSALKVTIEDITKEESDIYEKFNQKNKKLINERLNSLYFLLDSLKKKNKF